MFHLKIGRSFTQFTTFHARSTDPSFLWIWLELDADIGNLAAGNVVHRHGQRGPAWPAAGIGVGFAARRPCRPIVAYYYRKATGQRGLKPPERKK